MTTGTYTLQEFVREAKAIVAERADAARTITALTGPLERIIARPDCLADVAPDADPDPDRGFVIHRADDLTILAVVWAPDSGTPIHNHNGWAMEGVISGLERNLNYQRTDDGARPWRAALEPLGPSDVPAGQTTCLPDPPADIHAVEIPAGKTLAIHIYGQDLLKQSRYRFDLDTGEVTPFIGRIRDPRTP